MEEITTVGIDLAKEVFALCVLDLRGAVVERKVLRRAAFERWAAALSPCTVAMEACGSAHHWGRYFAARGHTARLIAAEFVGAFRQGGKNDGDAYRRTLLTQGARSALQVALKTPPQRATHLQRWIAAWYARKGYHKTLAAIANKHARILCALLVRDQRYDPNA